MPVRVLRQVVYQCAANTPHADPAHRFVPSNESQHLPAPASRDSTLSPIIESLRRSARICVLAFFTAARLCILHFELPQERLSGITRSNMASVPGAFPVPPCGKPGKSLKALDLHLGVALHCLLLLPAVPDLACASLQACQ